jgi:acyl transferase domain-containing protein
MGFGGINTHAVVESYGAPDASLTPSLPNRALFASNQSSEIFVLQASSLAALRNEADALRPIARDLAQAELADFSAWLVQRLAGTTGTVRAAIVADSPAALERGLAQLLEADRATGPQVWLDQPKGRPRIGWLMPGQGSQQLEMGGTLLARDPAFAERAEKLMAVATQAGCRTLGETICPQLDRAGDLPALRQALASTEIAQPAICLTSLLWAERLKMLGLSPSVVAGHSLGELTALCVAGAIEEATLMHLASKRGQAMASREGNPGGMASLTTEENILLKKYLFMGLVRKQKTKFL